MNRREFLKLSGAALTGGLLAWEVGKRLQNNDEEMWPMRMDLPELPTYKLEARPESQEMAVAVEGQNFYLGSFDKADREMVSGGEWSGLPETLRLSPISVPVKGYWVEEGSGIFNGTKTKRTPQYEIRGSEIKLLHPAGENYSDIIPAVYRETDPEGIKIPEHIGYTLGVVWSMGIDTEIKGTLFGRYENIALMGPNVAGNPDNIGLKSYLDGLSLADYRLRDELANERDFTYSLETKVREGVRAEIESTTGDLILTQSPYPQERIQIRLETGILTPWMARVKGESGGPFFMEEARLAEETEIYQRIVTGDWILNASGELAARSSDMTYLIWKAAEIYGGQEKTELIYCPDNDRGTMRWMLCKKEGK